MNEPIKLKPHYFTPKKREPVMFPDWPVWKRLSADEKLAAIDAAAKKDCDCDTGWLERQIQSGGEIVTESVRCECQLPK